jgi:hypothetical protein
LCLKEANYARAEGQILDAHPQSARNFAQGKAEFGHVKGRSGHAAAIFQAVLQQAGLIIRGEFLLLRRVNRVLFSVAQAERNPNGIAEKRRMCGTGHEPYAVHGA